MVRRTKEDRQREFIERSRQEYHTQIMRAWTKQVPEKLRGHELSELRSDYWNGRLTPAAAAQVRRYAAGETTQFLVLKGMKGLGKSTLAVTLARHFVSKYHVSGRYESLPRLLQEFSSFDRDQVSPVTRSIEVPILVLDDMGAANEGMTPHQQRCLWSVLDARWASGQTITIITTNMSINSTSAGMGLADWLGDSAWDRVSSSLTLIDFNGTSMRVEDDIDE